MGALLLSMGPLLAVTLAVLLAVQGSLVQIRVVEGEGAVNTAGSRGPGLTLEITDEIGRPVSGAVVSVRLPDDGPAGAFSSGLASEIVVTGAAGRVVTSPIRWNRVAGPLQIRVTVAKDRLRAGTVISQYLTDVAVKKGSAPAVAVRSKPRSKWLAVALIAAGAGFATGLAVRGRQDTAKAPGDVQIGVPSITITKP